MKEALDEIRRFKATHPTGLPNTQFGQIPGLGVAANESFKLMFFLSKFPTKEEFARTGDFGWNYKLLNLQRYEDFGNFMYGLLGTRLGISPLVLRLGAGAFQQEKLKLLFDETRFLRTAKGIPIPDTKFFENLTALAASLGDDPRDYPLVSDGIAAGQALDG